MNHLFCACYRHCLDMNRKYKHERNVPNNCEHDGHAKLGLEPVKIYVRRSECVPVEIMLMPGNVAVSNITNSLDFWLDSTYIVDLQVLHVCICTYRNILWSVKVVRLPQKFLRIP